MPAATVAESGRPVSSSRAPSALSIAPHSTPDVPPALAAHSLPAAVSTEAWPAPSSTTLAAAARAADDPLTIPRPWSPSPAMASIRPSSSSASASISAIASKARATSLPPLRPSSSESSANCGVAGAVSASPPVGRSPAAAAGSAAPFLFAGGSAGGGPAGRGPAPSGCAPRPHQGQRPPRHIETGDQLADFRLDDDEPTIAQQPGDLAPHHEQFLVLGAAKSVEDHRDSL